MNLKLSVCALLITLFVSGAWSQTVSPAERLSRAAGAKIMRGDYDGAIADLTKAIDLDPPELGQLYMRRAELYRDKRDYERAWADATKALPLLKGPAQAYRFRGETAVLREQWSVAKTELTKALELFPEDTMSLVNRSVAKGQLGDKAGAIADLTDAIKTVPASFLYIRRANAFLNNGDKIAAFKDYNTAVELDPKSASALTARGEAYYLDKNYALAFADLNKAIGLDKNSVEAFHYLGHLHHDKGELGLAIDAFTNAIKLNPDAGFYLDRGLVLRDQLDFDKAETDLAKAAELAPDNGEVNLAVAYMMLLRGNGAGAYTLAEEILAKRGLMGAGDHAVVIGYLGYLTEGAPVEAKAFLKKWSASIEAKPWEGKLVRFLNGQMTAPQLLAAAKTDTERTEARALIGANAVLNNRAAPARPHLSWIRTSGKKGSWAYMLGYVLWDRFFAGPSTGESID